MVVRRSEDERASWKRGRVSSEAMDDGSVFHLLYCKWEKTVFVRVCPVVVCLVLVGVSWSRSQCPCQQWLVRGRLLAHVEFYRTWLVLLFSDAAPGTPIQAAGSCQLVNSYCGTG